DGDRPGAGQEALRQAGGGEEEGDGPRDGGGGQRGAVEPFLVLPQVARRQAPAAAAGVLDALEGGLAAVLGDDAVVVVVGHGGDRGDGAQQVARLEVP